jgi:hypothetical protein
MDKSHWKWNDDYRHDVVGIQHAKEEERRDNHKVVQLCQSEGKRNKGKELQQPLLHPHFRMWTNFPWETYQVYVYYSVGWLQNIHYAYVLQYPTITGFIAFSCLPQTFVTYTACLQPPQDCSHSDVSTSEYKAWSVDNEWKRCGRRCCGKLLSTSVRIVSTLSRIKMIISQT